MDITVFIDHLEEMKESINWVQINEGDLVYKEEQCSVKDFLTHFKDKEEWKVHITEKKNTFLQTLFLDNIFV